MTAGTNMLEKPERPNLDLMSSAIFEQGLSLRYISLRARKVPKIKRPAFIWLKDVAKGGRGPETYHQEFLSALFDAAGAVFVFPGEVSKNQEKSVIDAALSTGCAVAVLTTPRCVNAWTQATKLGEG